MVEASKKLISQATYDDIVTNPAKLRINVSGLDDTIAQLNSLINKNKNKSDMDLDKSTTGSSSMGGGEMSDQNRMLKCLDEDSKSAAAPLPLKKARTSSQKMPNSLETLY